MTYILYMEKRVTKTDLIVQAFGTADPAIQRLVELEKRISISAALGDTPVGNCIEYGMGMEEILEWKILMDRFYDDAVEVLKKRQINLN